MAFLPTTTEPEALIEEYAVEVARRLGYTGPQARNQAVLKALQTLIDVLPAAPADRRGAGRGEGAVGGRYGVRTQVP